MSKHTPGPWTVGMQSGHNASTVFSGDDDRSIAAVFGLPLNQHIDEIRFEARFSEALANARLIAAAPQTAEERDRLKELNAELLEALRYYATPQPICTSKCHDGYEGCEYPKCHEPSFAFYQWDKGSVALAAIAKAEGQT